MATVTKDFRVKAGLVVEGSTATVNGHDILTEGLVDAKGDLLVGTQDNTVTRVALGTDGYILTADANEASGVKWAAAPAVGTFTSSVTFEGATADSYQTTLEVAEPTADRTITLPNATGTVALTSDITSAVDALTTDDIEEGEDKLYFTNQRAIDAVGGSATSENTPNTVVKRDANGDFAAEDITVNEISIGSLGRIYEDGGDLVIANVNNTDVEINTNDFRLNAEDDIRLEADDFVGITSLNGIIELSAPDGNVYIGEQAPDTKVVVKGTLDNRIGDVTVDGTTGNTITDRIATAKSEAITDANSYTDSAVTDAIGDIPTSTDELTEGTTNLYFTDTRARLAVDNGDGLNYNSTTGVFTAHLGSGLEIFEGAIRIDDSVVATETDLSTAISDHNVASGVHGVTGDIVGTTDSQIISNKTLGGDLAAGGYKITNLGSPDNSTDAATKGYVDAVSEGLHIHEAARVAINGNISIANGLENGDTAGGVTLATGDRVLVKDQTNAAENGIYVVQASGQALRATDFDTAVEVDSGDFIFVTSGTYANTGWVQTLKPATIGTDALSFTQFSGAGTFTAGNGLSLNGTVFSINETITATKAYVDEELDAHIDLTENVHGVDGHVVGTSGTQTLTDKILGSGTVLGASIDAVNTYTIINLEDPTNNQDAATKGYVDTEITGVGTDLTTHQNATTGVHGVTGNIVGTTDVQTLEGKTISYEDNTITVQVANVSDLTASATELNYVDGVTSSVQDQLDDKAPLDSPSLTTPNIGVATATSIAFADALLGSALATAGTSATTIDTWSATTYSSAKYIVQMKKGSDIEVIEVLVTVDGNNNVYLTEYADVISNVQLGTTNAVYSGGNVLLQVTGAAADTAVKVSKTYIEA